MTGEGFAFHCWHRLMWPHEHTCQRHFICHRFWEGNDR